MFFSFFLFFFVCVCGGGGGGGGEGGGVIYAYLIYCDCFVLSSTVIITYDKNNDKLPSAPQ